MSRLVVTARLSAQFSTGGRGRADAARQALGADEHMSTMPESGPGRRQSSRRYGLIGER
jgi:hypothetical protein